MAELILNFKDVGNAVVLSGRQRGVVVRKRYKLGEKEREENFICKIIVPDSIKVITASFLLGLFDESVLFFGSKEKFLQHYKFTFIDPDRKEIFDDDMNYLYTAVLKDQFSS